MAVRTEDRAGGAVRHVTLDNGKGNVIDAAVMDGIAAAIDGIGPHHKALVFEGAGRHFSFGASVPEHRAAAVGGMLARFHGLFRRMLEVAVPTSAIVRGQCLGGGLELAAFCTFVVAAPDAHFGQPEIKLAVFPPMASLLLPWRVGGGAALDLVVSGRTVDAAAAHAMGLVTDVAGDPSAHWEALVEKELLPSSAAALRFAERAARMGLRDAIEARLARLEALYLRELMATHDANEGIEAFVARRAPRFEDR